MIPQSQSETSTSASCTEPDHHSSSEHIVLISPVPVSSASASVSAGTQFESTPAPDHPLLESSFPSDFYNYVRHAGSLRDSEKFRGLQDHFRPTKLFSFPNHLEYGKLRAFRFCWLEEHNWLAYSPSCDGAYCKLCALFGSETGD